MNEHILPLVAALPELERATGMPFVVIGGLARCTWAEARSTFDVDVIVPTTQMASIVSAAGQAGLVALDAENQTLASAHMMRLRLPSEPRGRVRMDILFASHPFYERVVARAVRAQALGLTLTVARAEDVIVLKALAGRPQDKLDIEAIIKTQAEALDRALMRQEAAALELELPDGLR